MKNVLVNTRLLSFILIFFSILYVFSNIAANFKIYEEKFDPNLYKTKYEKSQWMVPNSKNPISDSDLYTYAGYRYIHGENPFFISPETPPIGKYIIGTSILIFNNQRISSLIFALASLLLIFILVQAATGSLITASLALFLTSVNTLFIDQIIFSPQLDIFHLFFFLAFFYVYFLYKKHGKMIFLILSGIFMGMFINSKVILISYFILNVSLGLYFLLKQETIKKILYELSLINIFATATTLLIYLQYFLLGGTVRGFLGSQKWVVNFYAQSQIDMTKLYGNYLGLIFLNKWRFWTEGYPYVKYHLWSVIWPLIFVLGFIAIFKLYKNRKKDILINLLISFIIIYNAFLFIVPIFPRYLLLLFVPLNILIALYFDKIVVSKKLSKRIK